jgi:tryptophan synthase alpha chain
MSDRLSRVFDENTKLLSVFVTAGFPRLNDTVSICTELALCGVDFIELGIPFSDSVADGPTIQDANTVALSNGMTLAKVFEAVREIRKSCDIPIILMGSFNSVLNYGVERFCAEAQEAGADGTILPDLPFEYFEEHYSEVFSRFGLANMFLITPQTTKDRIKRLDAQSSGFLYVVSGPGVTGGSVGVSPELNDYLLRLRNMNLKSPLMVGFGIRDGDQMDRICEFADGVIVGSAFIRALADSSDPRKDTRDFIRKYFPRTQQQ